MLIMDYTTKILNLEDVIVTDVKNIADQLHVYLELPRKKHTCPCCGAKTDCIHDYRLQRIKDIPLGRTTFLFLRKRRYRCSCGKRFFEKNSFLPRYYRVTSRLVAEIIFAFKKLTSATDIASRYNISAPLENRGEILCLRYEPSFSAGFQEMLPSSNHCCRQIPCCPASYLGYGESTKERAKQSIHQIP